MKTLKLFLACTCIIILASCSKNPSTSGPASVSVNNILTGSTFVTFEINGINCSEIAYLAIPVSESTPSPDEIFSTGTKLLSGNAGCVSMLDPDSRYNIHAVGKNPEGNYSAIVSTEFMTEKEKDFRFNVNFMNYCSIGLHSVVPSDKDSRYALFLHYGTLEDFLKNNQVNDLNEAAEKYKSLFDENPAYIHVGTTPEQIPDIEGNSNWAFTTLKSNSSYILLAWYVDENNNPISTPCYLEIKTTPVPEKSPLEIRLEDYEIGKNALTLTLDSNQSERYISDDIMFPLFFETWSGVGAYPISSFEEGLSDLEIVLKKLEEDKKYGYENGRNVYIIGKKYDFEYSSICFPCIPGEEYILTIYGTWEWNLTTAPVTLRFTIPEDYVVPSGNMNKQESPALSIGQIEKNKNLKIDSGHGI